MESDDVRFPYTYVSCMCSSCNIMLHCNVVKCNNFVDLNQPHSVNYNGFSLPAPCDLSSIAESSVKFILLQCLAYPSHTIESLLRSVYIFDTFQNCTIFFHLIYNFEEMYSTLQKGECIRHEHSCFMTLLHRTYESLYLKLAYINLLLSS